MKNIITKTAAMFILALVLNSVQPANAAIHIVNVANNTFTPDDFTVAVGDTVRWMWQAGNHTTTSMSIPGGAAPWDSPLNATIRTFDYVPTIPGEYLYVCTPHAPGMAGRFTANAAVGFAELASGVDVRVFPNPASEALVVEFSLASPEQVAFQLLGLNGVATLLKTADYGPGAHRVMLPIQNHPFAAGTYYMRIVAGNASRTRPVVLR